MDFNEFVRSFKAMKLVPHVLAVDDAADIFYKLAHPVAKSMQFGM